MDDALPPRKRLLEQARALIPVLAERAAATIAARDVPPETIADFHRIGILRIIQPRRFGGLQLRFSLFSRIVEVITEGCASSGWVYAVLGEHQWLLASYPLQAQIDVWGDDPRALASSSLAPRAVAERVAGGWRLSGQYLVLQRQHARALGDHRRIPRADRRSATASATCWCRSPTSRSSTTGTCSDWPAPAVVRSGCATCSCPSIAACC